MLELSGGEAATNELDRALPVEIYGDESAQDSKKKHEHGDAAFEYCADPLRLNRLPELRYVYRFSHYVPRVFQQCQCILILLVDTHKQRTTTSERTRIQIRWDATRLKQIANLPAFCRIVENA